MKMSDFIAKRGVWSNEILTREAFFRFFRRPIVAVDALFLSQTEYWPLSNLRDLQWPRIQEVVTAARQIPFWKEWLSRSDLKKRSPSSWTDFELIPIVSKADLKEQPVKNIFSGRDILHRSFADRTSGSTGEPFLFYVDRNYVLRSFSFCRRIFRWAGWRHGDIIVRLGGRDRRGFALDYHYLPTDTPADMERSFNNLVRLGESYNIVLFSLASILLRFAQVV